jgi:small basic protein (TIGR04137 family)
MSLDKSLKGRGRLKRSRNVLTRAERIETLEEEGRWQEGDSPFGLPSVRVRRMRTGKKKKEKEEKAAGTAEGSGESSEKAT